MKLAIFTTGIMIFLAGVYVGKGNKAEAGMCMKPYKIEYHIETHDDIGLKRLTQDDIESML